ncbi:MAG: hypothetical protein LH474_08535 [Chamaesiphon sp.]|nr:hypothetical protein [Chamaesiphon sp.]
MTENTQSNAVESTQKSDILPEKCSQMKTDIQDEAQQMIQGQPGDVSKPKTLTEACNTMKVEIKDEAKRLVPDLGNHRY